MLDNAKKEFMKSKKYYTVIVVVVLLSIVAIVSYSRGYRLTSPWSVGKVGTLSMQIPLPLTSVFVDQSQKFETSGDNQTLLITLSPGKHSVIVSRTGYYPWTKSFEMPSGGNIALSPMFVSQNASGEIITTKDPDYYKIKNMVLSDTLPTKNYPKLSADKNTSLWLENNAVMISSANGEQTVIQPETPVKNLDFYKGRSDVFIFSTGNWVYVIEKNDVGGQNFMPIFRGVDPKFINGGDGFIYVLDGNNLMEVII